MLFSKKKLVSSVIGTLLLSSSLMAEVKFSGTAGVDLFYRTNQIKKVERSKYKGDTNEEVSILANVDGNHEMNSIVKTINWRLSSKVATDARYDSLGIREAWIGGTTDIGEFRFGNQFSNLYLIQDYPYGSNGAGNIWADFGAHEVQYGRGVSYFSPDIYGFKVSAQLDIGEKGFTRDEDDVRIGDKILQSYAGEILLTYDSKYIRLDAGYYQGVNSGVMDSESDVFGGKKTAMGANYSQKDNRAEEFYLGSIVKLSDFKMFLGYSHNHWSGDTVEELGEDTRLHKGLVKGEYAFMQKHSVSLGYMRVFNSRTVKDGSAVNNKDAINAYDAQYNYSITNNISTFVQVRHHSLKNRYKASVMAEKSQLDGRTDNAKNVTKILIGTSLTF